MTGHFALLQLQKWSHFFGVQITERPPSLLNID